MSNTVTQAQVDAAIEKVEFHKLGEKTTVGLCTLKNGFEILESSACVVAANYDPDIGASIVMQRIKDKIWGYLGFQLQDSLYAGKLVASALGNKITDQASPENGIVG